MNYYNQLKKELINNEVYKKVKDYSKNKSDLTTYYNVGKLIVEAQGDDVYMILVTSISTSISLLLITTYLPEEIIGSFLTQGAKKEGLDEISTSRFLRL